MRTITSLVLFLSITIAGVMSAQAERRVALVIGNSEYQHTASLANPKNDAEAVSKALLRLGFEVHTGIDVDIHKMIGLVRDFSRALEGADVALFYYAGHGLQVDGNNYLAPVDARLDDQADLDFGTVKLSSILRQMDRHRAANLVFLDACRDNPLTQKLARSMQSTSRSTSFGRGLARVEAGIGTLIAYATQPGNIALDGEDGHSPFTKAFLNHVETPGQDISSMMIKVRQDVIRITDQKQIPWDHSSLTGQFYFKPPEDKPKQQVAAVDPTAKPAPETTAPVVNDGNARAYTTRLQAEQNAMELSFWNTIKDSNDPDLLESYLKRFPDGVYSDLARILMARAKKKAAQPKPVDVASADQSIEPRPVQPEPNQYALNQEPEQKPTPVVNTNTQPAQQPSTTQQNTATAPSTQTNQGRQKRQEPQRQAALDTQQQTSPTVSQEPNTQSAQPEDPHTGLAALMANARGGDRDAAVYLAKHFDRQSDPNTAAKYAMMALRQGGVDYADQFIRDTRAWTKPFWSALQGKLKQNGAYRGAIDGDPGRGTKSAVQIYAGIAVIKPQQPVIKRQPKRVVKPQAPRQQPRVQPTRNKPAPNKWCLVDPNSARCTNQ